MDPNANLQEQRRLTAELQNEIDNLGRPDAVKVDRLLALVEALDTWITKGGFLPKDWERK